MITKKIIKILWFSSIRTAEILLLSLFFKIAKPFFAFQWMIEVNYRYFQNKYTFWNTHIVLIEGQTIIKKLIFDHIVLIDAHHSNYITWFNNCSFSLYRSSWFTYYFLLIAWTFVIVFFDNLLFWFFFNYFGFLYFLSFWTLSEILFGSLLQWRFNTVFLKSFSSIHFYIIWRPIFCKDKKYWTVGAVF